MSIITVKQIEMLKKDHRDGSRCRAQNCDKQLEDYLVVKAVDEVVFSGCRAVVPPPQSPHTDETSPATQHPKNHIIHSVSTQLQLHSQTPNHIPPNRPHPLNALKPLRVYTIPRGILLYISKPKRQPHHLQIGGATKRNHTICSLPRGRVTLSPVGRMETRLTTSRRRTAAHTRCAPHTASTTPTVPARPARTISSVTTFSTSTGASASAGDATRTARSKPSTNGNTPTALQRTPLALARQLCLPLLPPGRQTMKQPQTVLCGLVHRHLVLVLASLLGERAGALVNPLVAIDLDLPMLCGRRGSRTGTGSGGSRRSLRIRREQDMVNTVLIRVSVGLGWMGGRALQVIMRKKRGKLLTWMGS